MTASIYCTGLLGTFGYTGAHLRLPATADEIQDAMDRARIGKDQPLSIVDVYDNSGNDYSSISLPHNPPLAELNFLASRIAGISDNELLNFKACARTENQPPDMKRLINLTYNLQECVVAEEAGNDEALGKFLVDNDMIDCLRGIPDEALAFLDYKKIGSNQRDTENGVFVDGHYVVNLSADFREVYDGEHLPEQPAESNSVIRLKLRKVNDGREVTEGEWLALPATQDELKATLGKLQAGSLDDCFIARNESIVPLFDNNFSLDADIEEINALAGRVVQLRDQNLLPKYKAILEFTGCTELDQAVDLTTNLSCYDFYPEIFKEDDLRRRTFAEQYHIPADDPILKTIRFDHSDAGLMTEDMVKPTDYGFVRRNDAPFQQEYMKPDPSQQMGQI
jgi:hypothetical protein